MQLGVVTSLLVLVMASSLDARADAHSFDEGDEETIEGIYGLAAEVFDSIADASDGDAEAKNPEVKNSGAFAQHITPAKRANLKGRGSRIDGRRQRVRP